MFPRGFVFKVIIPMYLVEPISLVVCDSVLLVENQLDRRVIHKVLQKVTS
jgi:hypothetical protein